MSGMESTVAVENVFTAEYLQALSCQDEPAGAGEGELAGPWQVVEGRPGTWEVVRLWESSAVGLPRISATDQETALLFAATLPAVGRAPLFRALDTGEIGKLRLESEGRAAAELAGVGEEAMTAAHVAGCLARSPWALALLMEAAGPAVQREVGEILFRRMK